MGIKHQLKVLVFHPPPKYFCIHCVLAWESSKSSWHNRISSAIRRDRNAAVTTNPQKKLLHPQGHSEMSTWDWAVFGVACWINNNKRHSHHRATGINISLDRWFNHSVVTVYVTSLSPMTTAGPSASNRERLTHFHCLGSGPPFIYLGAAFDSVFGCKQLFLDHLCMTRETHTLVLQWLGGESHMYEHE